MERIRVLFLHADYAKSAEFFFFFMVHAGAGEVANFVTTRVRRADANVYRLEVYSPALIKLKQSGFNFHLSDFRFPFVTPLRPPVACNCDLLSASVNS